MELQKWIKQTDSESGYVSIDKYCSKVRMFKQSYEIETVLFLNLQIILSYRNQSIDLQRTGYYMIKLFEDLRKVQSLFHNTHNILIEFLIILYYLSMNYHMKLTTKDKI